jgi:hypothetical protein
MSSSFCSLRGYQHNGDGITLELSKQYDEPPRNPKTFLDCRIPSTNDQLSQLANVKGAILAALGEGIPGALLTPAELPPTVEKIVSEPSNGATIRGFAADMEDGERIRMPELAISGRGETGDDGSEENRLTGEE